MFSYFECAGHLFSMAIDFQLFLYGLLAIYLINKSRYLGFIFCAMSAVYSYIVLALRAIKYETTGTIYTPFPTPIKIVEYLQFIYMTTDTYIPSYVLGFICGYLYASGFKLRINTIYDHGMYLFASGLLQHMVSIINGLANEFNLIPQSMVWFQIILNRIFFTSAMAMMMMYFLSIDSIFGIKLDKIESSLIKKKKVDANSNDISGNNKENNDKATNNLENIEEKKPNEVQYSFFTGLCRLSYAIFLSNYLLVKYEFSTSRSLLSFDWYPLIKRLTGSMVFCFIFSFTFYCFFIAPFDQLNKRYFFNRGKKSKSDNKIE